MKGIGHIKNLIRVAGGAGVPYAEAFVRVLIEEGDYKVADELRDLIKTISPHQGVAANLEPSQDRKRTGM